MSRGFTLIELMVTLAVAVVLLTVGVPGFKSMIERNKNAAAVNGFISSMTYARSEAVKRGAYVSVCASDARLEDNREQQRCTGSDWVGGYAVFMDADRGCNPTDGAGVLRVAHQEGSITAVSREGSAVSCVRYGPIGEADAGYNTLFTVSVGDFSSTRCLRAVGRMDNLPFCD